MNAHVPFVTYPWRTRDFVAIVVVVIRFYLDHGVDDFIHSLVVYSLHTN